MLNTRKTLIDNFLRIAKVPRESGNEEQIANFFVNIAKENNLYVYKDRNNNVLIKKKGNKNTEPIALQAHLDMVCVKKKDSIHNFETDGIEVIIKGDKVTSKDTSLGADQGVGLTLLLTIIENKNLIHPDLEILLTSEEETTFNGAVTFPYGKVVSKRMINLDNAKYDSIIIGADGDICNEYFYKGTLIENCMQSYKILMDNFPGGNSSENMEGSKTNAISTMANLLKNNEIYLKSINGGINENDIATFCEAIINTELNIENIANEENIKVTKIENTLSFTKEDTKNILNQIVDLQSGIQKKDVSSANLGRIKTIGNKVKMEYVMRSTNEKELIFMNEKSKQEKNNFQVNEIYEDSIWKPNKKSKLLEDYKKVYIEEYREYPKEEIWHGSIECSTIKKRIKDLDIISIGSNIEKFHTTEEITYIKSWMKTYNLLIKLLEQI